MNKREIDSMIKKVEKNMKSVKTIRDRLDEDIATLEHLKQNCEEAWDNLEMARNALSELV